MELLILIFLYTAGVGRGSLMQVSGELTRSYPYNEWSIKGSTLKTMEIPVFSCSTNEDCIQSRNISNSACVETEGHGKTCACVISHVPHSDEAGTFLTCLPKAVRLHDHCSENLQCTANMSYVECKDYQRCGCIHGAIQDDTNGPCHVATVMGEMCNSDKDCSLATPGAICNKTLNICKCPENLLYNPKMEVRACVERATKIGRDCDYEVHFYTWHQKVEKYSCDLIKNATCDGESKTCGCYETFVPVYFDELSPMKCVERLGDRCPDKFIFSEVSPGWCKQIRNSGETCDENRQCSSGRCVEGQCGPRWTLIQYLLLFLSLTVVILISIVLFFLVGYFRRRNYPHSNDGRSMELRYVKFN